MKARAVTMKEGVSYKVTKGAISIQNDLRTYSAFSELLVIKVLHFVNAKVAPAPILFCLFRGRYIHASCAFKHRLDRKFNLTRRAYTSCPTLIPSNTL